MTQEGNGSRVIGIHEKAKRKTIRALASCALAVFLLPWAGAGAEGIQEEPLPEHIRTADYLVVDDRCGELSAFSITFRNTRGYTPECFNPARVSEGEAPGAGAGGILSYYQYEDGSSLTIPSSTGLVYGSRDAERYRQLLIYLKGAGSMPAAAAEPYPLADALARCDSLFSRLHISGLVLDSSLALTADRIGKVTGDMRRGSTPAPACFDSFPAEIGAWCLTFRQELDGIRSAGTPQVRIVLTERDTALLELNRVIDHVNDDYQLAAQASWQDALDLFSATHREEAAGDESFEISRINLAFAYELPDQDALDARAVPCWQIEGRTARGNQVVGFSEVYRIPDGKKNAV